MLKPDAPVLLFSAHLLPSRPPTSKTLIIREPPIPQETPEQLPKPTKPLHKQKTREMCTLIIHFWYKDNIFNTLFPKKYMFKKKWSIYYRNSQLLSHHPSPPRSGSLLSQQMEGRHWCSVHEIRTVCLPSLGV